MRRAEKKVVNKIRHLQTEAKRLFDRMDELCPPVFRDEKDIARENDLGYSWNLAFDASFQALDAFTMLILELDPASFHDDRANEAAEVE